MNDAVANLVKKGIFVAIAAGNANTDAARTSPASERLGCTAGASDSNDNKAFFSNYGAALDIQAPGVGVTSLSPGGGRVRFLADMEKMFD
jgi:subtilisin family serine protease